jgi:hypothetical protein
MIAKLVRNEFVSTFYSMSIWRSLDFKVGMSIFKLITFSRHFQQNFKKSGKIAYQCVFRYSCNKTNKT